MGSKEWLEAAELEETRKKLHEVEAKATAEEALKLESFLSSIEGNAARRLLTATAKHILFGQLTASPGHAFVCFLDGEGLRRSIEGEGLSGAYEGKKPDVSSCTSQQAAEAFRKHIPAFGRMKPTEIVVYLHHELDKIAEGIKKG